MGRAATAAAAALALCLALVPSAAAAGGNVAGHAVAQAPAEVREYWTPERMREAEPLVAPVEVAAAGPASRGASAAPAAAPTASAAAQPPDVETDPARDTAYPERIHGRLFVTFGADDSSCSATVVRSFTRNLLLTAGHCVVNPTAAGPQWAANVAFVPGYRNNARPFGTYSAIKLRAPGIWAFEGDISFDVGAINLVAGPTGQIQDALGARGVSFNRTPGSYKGKRFRVFGYPADPGAFYDGERLIVCDSPFQGIEEFTGALKAGPCHQQQGSSGAGWVLGGGLLNSVVSHGACRTDSDACQVTSGTYFGDFAFSLWVKAAGGLPKGRKKRIANCRRKGKKARRCLVRAMTFKPVVR
ncbi:MAG: trypsin-like serine peptidase [Solirubrobacterales bacterium]